MKETSGRRAARRRLAAAARAPWRELGPVYLEGPEGLGDGASLGVEAVVEEGVPASRVDVGGLLPREVAGGEAADLRAWGEEKGEARPRSSGPALRSRATTSKASL